jgi:GAF domain-containing protein
VSDDKNGLETLVHLLEQRRDSAGVAIFDVLQAALSICDFDIVVVAELAEDSPEALRVLATAEQGDASRLRTLGLRPGVSFEYAGSFEQDVLALRTAVVVPDTVSDVHYRARGESKGIRAYLGVPLVGTDEVPIGVLSAYSFSPRPISKASLLGMKVFARQLARELEIRRATESLLEGSPEPVEVIRALASLGRSGLRPADSLGTDALGNAVNILLSVLGIDIARLKKSDVRRGTVAVETSDRDRAAVRRNEWPAPVDEVVKAAGDLLPPLPGARIDVYPSSGAFAACDRATLERIVANLLLHAWRSAPPGTPIVVESIAVGDGAVEIAVEDRSGLTPVESLARRMHPAGSRRIGLPIARALTEDLGGTLRQVPTGEGRRYIVRLPTHKPQVIGGSEGEQAGSLAERRRSQQSPHDAGKIPGAGKGPTIGLGDQITDRPQAKGA